ncbi:MAG TPA: FtsX-like permease family protein [Gammaproteobacteria bacterium]|nr:FtsX-like permease family protein [Gammaproteobacteria bacterium]
MRSFLQVRPILVALRRHKAAVTLLVLEIALTMALLGNLVFIVNRDIQRFRTPTGVVESQIGVIQSIGVIGKDETNTVGGNLAALRAVPGVEEAAYGGPPIWDSNRVPIFLAPARQHPVLQAYELYGSQGFSRSLGLHVVEGHDFIDNDLPNAERIFGGGGGKPPVMPVLVTRNLAHNLYGSVNPLGRTLYDGTFEMRVIGVLDYLRGELTGRASDDNTIVAEFHVGPEHLGGGFIIRAQDGARLSQTLRSAAAALQKADPGHVQAQVLTFPELRTRYFRGALATGRMLIAIMLIMLVVTAVGVSGLASFWVQQRRRQIGMRRALGATRGDILRYFQIENLLIVTGGIVLGAAFAYLLNLFLMRHFELQRLPPDYLVIGAIVLWLLGQLAVLAPALRAAAVPPVEATRSV